MTFDNMTAAAEARHQLTKELAKHLKDSKEAEARLRSELAAAEAALRVGAAGFNLALIEAAESVIYLRGAYARGGTDRAGVIRDAIAEIATGEKQGYRGLWKEQFGTKDYAHWHGQRSDHEYGYGPAHGWIIFAVGLRQHIRQRDPQELSAAEREACVYYLTNIESIQAQRAEQLVAA